MKKQFKHIAVSEETFKQFKALKAFQISDDKLLAKIIKEHLNQNNGKNRDGK